jgi:uncharacterized membrane protein
MRWLIAALFAVAGIAHVHMPEGLLAITPDWVPFAPQVIFYTGLFELVAALALLTRRFRMWAGIALALYSLAVWPANIKHAFESIHVAVIPDTWWYHAPRLALQPVIIWWALYCSGVVDWPWRKRPVLLP